MNDYTIKLTNSQIYTCLIYGLSYTLLFCLFFPIRKVFFTPEAYLTGQYSDFTSFSLYLSDVVLIFLFILIKLPRGIRIIKQNNSSSGQKLKYLIPNFYYLILILWLILGIFLNFSNTSLYWTARFILLTVAYETIRIFVLQTKENTNTFYKFINFFLYLSTFQAILTIFQFFFQRPLGMFRLGEQILSSTTPGFAKIIVSGETLVRGYGTFPHPNVLGAFFVISILLSTWKLLTIHKNSSVYIYSVILFINITGLFATFSRSAFYTSILGLLVLFTVSAYKKFKNSSINRTLIVILTSFAMCFVLFKPFLLSRASINDQAVHERKEYNHIGMNMLKNNLLVGVGVGNSVLHMQQYSQSLLQPWQKQPIHNYFLLSAVELGIPGALFLVAIFFQHFKYVFAKAIKAKKLLTIYPLLTAILISFFLLMLFDHYFYTLNQTQLLLWGTLGIIAGIKKLSLKGE